jgi:hypothetical protein
MSKLSAAQTVAKKTWDAIAHLLPAKIKVDASTGKATARQIKQALMRAADTKQGRAALVAAGVSSATALTASALEPQLREDVLAQMISQREFSVDSSSSPTGLAVLTRTEQFIADNASALKDAGMDVPVDQIGDGQTKQLATKSPALTQFIRLLAQGRLMQLESGENSLMFLAMVYDEVSDALESQRARQRFARIHDVYAREEFLDQVVYCYPSVDHPDVIKTQILERVALLNQQQID